MARYLTPTKICVLVLIQTYNADDIPRANRLEAASFIASHINLSSESNHDDLEPQINLFSSDITSFSSTLSKWPSNFPGRSIYDLFLRKLWMLSDLDRLFHFFEEVQDIVASASQESQEETARKISRASPLGQFIRRCCVEFTRLQFSDSQKLWASLQSYLAPSYDGWAARNPDLVEVLRESQRSSFTAAHSTQGADTEIAPFIGADDTSTLLMHSIHHLQKLGTRVPPTLKTHLSTWLNSMQDSSNQSLQHFLAFFEHWRAGAYNMALEALHRYFDYSLMAQQEPARTTGVGGGMKMYYQYALLHLSLLHADFERWEESLEALGECIGTARENQDPSCLNFALSYLLYLRQAHPQNSQFSFANLTKLVGGGGTNGNGESEISFLKAKAREGRHWSLLATTFLEESRSEMHAGGNFGKALECILQSEYLCMQHDLRTIMPAGALFRGGSMERLGQATVGLDVYESISTVHADHCPLQDDVRASCRIAHSLAGAGQFDEALEILKSSREGTAVGILKLQQRVRIREMLILLKRSIHLEDLDAAKYYLEQLQSARSFAESDVIFELTVLEVEMLLKQHDYQSALSIINNSIQGLKNDSKSADIAHRLHFLILKARIFACASQPIKGLSIALRAAATAERHLLVSVFVEALAVMGPILLALGEFAAARELMRAALPHALEGSDIHITARLFTLLAHSTLGAAGAEEEMGSAAQVKSVRVAGGFVERSYECYSRLNDLWGMLDCLALKAKLARWDDDESTGAQADEKYDQLLSDHTARLVISG